jgi:hypothetical protein
MSFIGLRPVSPTIASSGQLGVAEVIEGPGNILRTGRF